MRKFQKTKVMQKFINFTLITVSIIILIVTGMDISSGKQGPKSLPVNRWREVKRLNTDSVLVPFLDTMFISIKPKGAFSYHNKDAFVYRGVYTLDGKELDFGYAKFRVLYKKPTSMLLKDGHGFYQFGIDSTDTLRTIVLPIDEKIDSNITIDHMIGHWTVYKRTAVKPLTAVDHTTQIKSVIITGASTDGKLGYIFTDADKTNSPSWTIVKFNTNLSLDCIGKSMQTIKVIKCQSGELILEDEEIKYYFKQFK